MKTGYVSTDWKVYSKYNSGGELGEEEDEAEGYEQ